MDAEHQSIVINSNELLEETISYIDEFERSWWYQYKVQYFRSLNLNQKWIKTKRNMCVGDIFLIEYKCKSFTGTCWLGRVKKVEVDSNDGLACTCTVAYKLVKGSSKNLRDIFTDVTSKQVRLLVQRLVLILPVEEQ